MTEKRGKLVGLPLIVGPLSPVHGKYEAEARMSLQGDWECYVRGPEGVAYTSIRAAEFIVLREAPEELCRQELYWALHELLGSFTGLGGVGLWLQEYGPWPRYPYQVRK